MIKKHDKIIILDFDHTIFNTTAYVAQLQKDLEKKGVSKEEFWKQREALKDCCHLVDIDKFIEGLTIENKGQLHDVIHSSIKKHAKKFVFMDVADFIERHIKDYDFVIVTQGDQELQTEKVTHSEIADRISYEIVAEKKDVIVGKYVELYEDVYFIDDKAENIDHVKKMYPQIHAYFLRRAEDRPYGHILPKCECDYATIENLKLQI